MHFIAEKGVPSFWLTALKNNDVISEEVSYMRFWCSFYKHSNHNHGK